MVFETISKGEEQTDFAINLSLCGDVSVMIMNDGEVELAYVTWLSWELFGYVTLLITHTWGECVSFCIGTRQGDKSKAVTPIRNVLQLI